MQPILPLLRDDKEKDRVRKYYSSRSPETDPYEIAKYLDEKVIGPLSIEGKELVAFLRDRNAHFHSLIPGSLKKQFINPPAGSWWLPYISAYQSICSVDSDAHDEICLFLLKIVETEIELLRGGSSNRLKAVESGLLSPHGEPINSEADEVIDRLMFWAALDELMLSIFQSSSCNEVSLINCIPKEIDGQLRLSINQFLYYVSKENFMTKRIGLAGALGIDVAELRRLEKHEKLLCEDHLFELYPEAYTPMIFQTHRHINIWTLHQIELQLHLSAHAIAIRFELYEESKEGLNNLYQRFNDTGEIL